MRDKKSKTRVMQIAFYAFHSFCDSGSLNEGFIHATHGLLVITKGYGVQATTIEGQNLCCSIAVLCVSFTRQIVKTRVNRLGVIKGPNTRDQIAFCAFHSFLVEVQTNAGYIYATHA